MKSRWNHSALFALALIVLVFAVSACQAVAPGVSTPAPEAVADPEPEAVADPEPETVPVGDASLVVYSGRSENLVASLIQKFEAATGIDAEVRYGSTAEMAATILEEGDNSPADVFFSQDAGALGALDAEGRLAPLPEDLLEMVAPPYRSHDGTWIGVSGRARVLAYNTQNVAAADLPADVYGLTDPQWGGRVGWAPTNASFQSFVTAMRLLDGEEKARAWLEGMLANDVQTYDSNDAIVAAVGAGEIDLGLVNHYYLYQFLKEQGDSFPVQNYYFPTAGAGSMVNVAGAGILNSASHAAAAEQFVRYLLSPEAEEYFANETNEYPLASGVTTDPRLKPLDEIALPPLDLTDLADLQATLELLQDVGALQ